MSASTVVITIGRNIGDFPMKDAQWTAFKQRVLSNLYDAGATVVQRPCLSDVAADQVGEWEGQREPAAAFIAFVSDTTMDVLVEAIATTLKHFDQQAAGFMVLPRTDHLVFAKE